MKLNLVLLIFAFTATANAGETSILAAEGDCSIAVKKLSNALVRVLAPAREKQESVRKFLEPDQHQPGGSPPMACYKETILSSETRDSKDPYSILELKKQILFFNSKGFTCYAKGGNTNPGGADAGEPDLVVAGFSTYIFRFPKDRYVKITVAGDKARTQQSIEKGIPLLDTALDKYAPLFGKPQNIFGGEFLITDPSPCQDKQIAEEYEFRAKRSHQFVADALKLVDEFKLGNVKESDELKPLAAGYERDCSKAAHPAVKALIQSNLATLK